MILLVDNYDSFVHNLARYLERLGQETLVVRNDQATPERVRAWQPDALVLSPGPCSPSEAGWSIELVQQFAGTKPILGVCLGHQAIASALGGQIVRAPTPMHGRTSEIWHVRDGVFACIPSPFVACRYHSLVVERSTLPSELGVAAETADGVIMAIAHRTLPVVGLQFHPEAILTQWGYAILANFLKLAGLKVPERLPDISDEYLAPRAPELPAPATPVTF